MGLAIADHPQGPYVKHEANPVIPGNHEVLVWPLGKGVAAMIGTSGPKEITNSILYSDDGIKFSKTHNVSNGPWAGGAFRPEAFTRSGNGRIPEWGVEIGMVKGKKNGSLPFIQRFDVTEDSASEKFSNDLAFMKKHTEIVLLQDGDSAVAVAPAYQGRVMTSTFDRKSGPSFGWINRPVIEKGLLSDEEKKGKLEEHIYIFGGEERFWLGPEGGQYAIFFKPGSKFEFSDWTTPFTLTALVSFGMNSDVRILTEVAMVRCLSASLSMLPATIPLRNVASSRNGSIIILAMHLTTLKDDRLSAAN